MTSSSSSSGASGVDIVMAGFDCLVWRKRQTLRQRTNFQSKVSQKKLKEEGE